MMPRKLPRAALLATLLATATASHARADKPSVEFALGLNPIQRDVDYDRPTAEEAGKCTLEAEAEGAATSWVVRTEAGQTLRRFQDSNGDNKVDRWCYFKNGVEVYRDIDANFNGKADQYRWLGSAGTRWGTDADEDGRIDAWTVISPEEVTAEVVAALRDHDAPRFQRLLIDAKELDTLGLGAARTEEIKRKITQAQADFESLSRKQNAVTTTSEWVFFGGGRPGVIPEGSDGNTRDVYLYDNVSAIVETDGKNAQLAIGPLVRVGDTWRLVDLPASLVEGEALSYFFQASLNARAPLPDGQSPVSESMQKLVADLDAIDRKLADADEKTAANLQAQRANLLENLAQNAQKDEERAIWYRQFADTVGAAVQTGAYPDGLGRLEQLVTKLTAANADKDLLSYVKFRYLMAQYAHDIQAPNADYAKIQESWLAQLQDLVKAHPKSAEAPEAMLQIAMAQEFAGQESQALEWYTRIAVEFPKSESAPKAAGASRRLNSVGQPFQLKGTALDGKPFDIASLKGKTVVVHYWATWCEPCKQDMATLATLATKYGKNGLVVVGINLDTDIDALRTYLRTHRPAWTHLQEPGGLDGQLANEMGILTLPTMFVIDRTGRMVNRSAHGSDVEKDLEKLLR